MDAIPPGPRELFLFKIQECCLYLKISPSLRSAKGRGIVIVRCSSALSEWDCSFYAVHFARNNCSVENAGFAGPCLSYLWIRNFTVFAVHIHPHVTVCASVVLRVYMSMHVWCIWTVYVNSKEIHLGEICKRHTAVVGTARQKK